jgi:hypothetical protein
MKRVVVQYRFQFRLFVLLRLVQVPACLEVEPELGLDTKEPRQPQGRAGGNSSLDVNQHR